MPRLGGSHTILRRPNLRHLMAPHQKAGYRSISARNWLSQVATMNGHRMIGLSLTSKWPVTIESCMTQKIGNWSTLNWTRVQTTKFIRLIGCNWWMIREVSLRLVACPEIPSSRWSIIWSTRLNTHHGWLEAKHFYIWTTFWGQPRNTMLSGAWLSQSLNRP